MRSGYSTMVKDTTGAAEQPMPPVLVSKDPNGTEENLVFNCPTTAVNGQSLPPDAYTELLVYASKDTFLGRLASLVGLEPHAKVSVTVGQQNVAVTVSGLEGSSEYEFVACVQ